MSTQTYENYYYDEDEINLIALIVFALKHIVFIAISCIVCCLLAFGFYKMKTGNSYHDSVKKATKQKQIAQTELDNLYRQQEILEKAIADSPLMQLDAQNVFEKDYLFFISPENPEYTESIVNTYIGFFNAIDLQSLFNSDKNDTQLRDVISFKTVNDKELKNEENKKTNISFNSPEKITNVITLTILAESQAETEIFGETLLNKLMLLKNNIEKASYPHNLTVEEKPVVNGFNEKVLTQQLSLNDSLLIIEDKITEAKKDLDSITIPTVSSKKYIIIGFVAGGFLACCYVLVKFLSSNPLSGSEDMEGIYFGAFNSQKASKMLSERRWGLENEKQYLETTLSENTKEGDTVAVVSSLKNVPEIDKVLKKLNRKALIITEAVTNPILISEIKKASIVILCEKPLVSKTRSIESIKAIIKQQNKEVKGFILFF